MVFLLFDVLKKKNKIILVCHNSASQKKPSLEILTLQKQVIWFLQFVTQHYPHCTTIRHELLSMVLAMISSKAVNDVKIVPECLLVLSRDKRWLDPISLAADPVCVILRQKQVVR